MSHVEYYLIWIRRSMDDIKLHRADSGWVPYVVVEVGDFPVYYVPALKARGVIGGYNFHVIVEYAHAYTSKRGARIAGRRLTAYTQTPQLPLRLEGVS